MSLFLFTKYNSLSLLEAQQPLDQQPARCLRQTRKMCQRITNWTNCMADSSEEILRLTTRSFTNVVTGAPEIREHLTWRPLEHTASTTQLDERRQEYNGQRKGETITQHIVTSCCYLLNRFITKIQTFPLTYYHKNLIILQALNVYCEMYSHNLQKVITNRKKFSRMFRYRIFLSGLCNLVVMWDSHMIHTHPLRSLDSQHVIVNDIKTHWF